MVTRVSAIFLMIFMVLNPDVKAQTICYDSQNNIGKNAFINSKGELIWTTHHGIYSNTDQGLQLIPFHTKYPMASGATWAIHHTKDQGDLIFFLSAGLFHITKDTTMLFSIQDPAPQGINSSEIYNIATVGDTLFLTSAEGLIIYSLSQKKELDLIRMASKSDSLMNRRRPNIVRDVEVDPLDSNLVWICGNRGVGRYDTKDNSFQQFSFDIDLMLPGHKKISPKISYLLLNLKKVGPILYMTSWGGGLVTFNSITKEWKNYLYQEYEIETLIEQNITKDLAVFNDSLLLLTTRSEGPYFFNYKTKENIPFEQVLNVKPESNNCDALYLNSAFVWIYYLNRLCRYKIPEKYKRATVAKSNQKVFIKNIHSNAVDLSNFTTTETYLPKTFSKEIRSLDFEFSTIGFSNLNDVEFQYLLEGYEKDWKSGGNSNQTSYNKLRGGRYTLNLRVKDGENYVWGIPYEFEIGRLLKEKRWFQLLLSLSVILITTGIWAYLKKVGNEKDRIEEKHRLELQQAELTALRAQMNPHFIFNSLASINQYIMYEDARNASKYLAKFAHLMRKILNNSLHGLISLQEELTTLDLYIEIEKIRFQNKFEFEKTISSDINLTSIFLPPMVIQPILENAILHGLIEKESNGLLKINVSIEGKDQLKITIEDNGMGRAEAAKNGKNQDKESSLGLKLTKERLSLLKDVNGLIADVKIIDLYNDKKLSEGTKVILTLPLITSRELNTNS